jgi:hypothetical protein
VPTKHIAGFAALSRTNDGGFSLVTQTSLPGNLYEQLPLEVKTELTAQTAEVKGQFAENYLREYKKLSTAYWLLLCYGLHLAYLNHYSQGVWFWFTVGGSGIWWILIEPFRLPSMVNGYNSRVAVKILRETIPLPAPEKVLEKPDENTK